MNNINIFSVDWLIKQPPAIDVNTLFNDLSLLLSQK